MGSYVQSLYREAMAGDNNGDTITPDGEIVTTRPSSAAQYSAIIAEDPEAAKHLLAATKAKLNYYKDVKDLPGTSKAVWDVIDLQEAYISRWDETVAQHGGALSKISDRKSYLTVAEAEERYGVNAVQISRWRKEHKDRQAYHDKLCAKITKQFLGTSIKETDDTIEPDGTISPRTNATGFYEWYTPPQFIEAAREAMGGIDLDPATSQEAQNVVNAKTFFTQEDDGLKQEWKGRVWLNPPYSQPLLSNFVSKLVDEYTSGNVKQAIILTHNFTDTGWFHKVVSEASAICFTRGRINFYGENGGPGSPANGQAFCYFGDDVSAFAHAFSKHGFIVTPFRWNALQTIELQANGADDEQ